MSYYDKGEKPRIAVVNRSTVDFANVGIGNFSALIAALRIFVDKYFAPVWGTPADLLEMAYVPPGHWGLYVFDTPEQAHKALLGDTTDDNLPIGKVYAKTALANKELIGVAVSRELAEMLVDPGVNLCAMRYATNTIYGYDVVDPVSDTDFRVNDIPMTNFVLPAWFEGFRKPGSAQFDHIGMIDRPFKLLSYGSAMVLKPDGRWHAIYGSKFKEREAKAHSCQRGYQRRHLADEAAKRQTLLGRLWPF